MMIHVLQNYFIDRNYYIACSSYFLMSAKGVKSRACKCHFGVNLDLMLLTTNIYISAGMNICTFIFQQPTYSCEYFSDIS